MRSAMSACSLMQGQMSLIVIFVFSMVHRTGMKLSVNGEKCPILQSNKIPQNLNQVQKQPSFILLCESCKSRIQAGLSCVVRPLSMKSLELPQQSSVVCGYLNSRQIHSHVQDHVKIVKKAGLCWFYWPESQHLTSPTGISGELDNVSK